MQPLPSWLEVKSSPMAMMPPTIVVVPVPTVVVAATAVMAPPMSMPVAAFDLNDCPIMACHLTSLARDSIDCETAVDGRTREAQMRERWLILAILTFARTAMGFQFQSVAAVSPFLLDHFKMSYAGLGTLVGLYLLPGVAVALLGCVLAQRFGDKRVVCVGLAAMTLGGALMGATENPSALFTGRIISGVQAVFLNVLVTKMVTDWFQGREIVSALWILITSWPLGIAIALVVLPALTQVFSWPAAMYMTAVGSAAALVLVAAYYRNPMPSRAVEQAHFWIDLTGHEVRLATLAGLVWTFYNIGFIIVLAFGPEFFIASGHNAAAASAIVSTVSWLIIPALPFGTWLAERIGRPDVTMVTCFLAVTLAIWLVTGLGPHRCHL